MLVPSEGPVGEPSDNQRAASLLSQVLTDPDVPPSRVWKEWPLTATSPALVKATMLLRQRTGVENNQFDQDRIDGHAALFSEILDKLRTGWDRTPNVTGSTERRL